MPSKQPKQPQPPKGYRLAEHGERYFLPLTASFLPKFAFMNHAVFPLGKTLQLLRNFRKCSGKPSSFYRFVLTSSTETLFWSRPGPRRWYSKDRAASQIAGTTPALNGGSRCIVVRVACRCCAARLLPAPRPLDPLRHFR